MSRYSSNEADDLKRRMQSVRCRMDGDVSGIVERSQELLDWRYYYQKYPWVGLGVAVGTGYLLVPRRGHPRKLRLDEATLSELKELAQCDGGAKEVPAPKSLLASALGVAGTMVLRAAIPVVAQRISQMFVDHEEDQGQARDEGE